MANINVYRTDSLSSWRLKTNDLSNNVGDKVVLMTMKGHDQDSLRPLAGDVVEALMQVNMALTTEYLLDTTDKFAGELSFTTGSVIKGDDELSLKSAAGLGLYIHADGRIAINTQTPIAGYALTVTGNTYVSANTLLKGTLEVDSSSQFDGNVSITGTNTLTVNSGLSSFKGAMTVASNTNAGNVTIGNTTSNPTLTLVGTGATTLGGALNVTGITNLNNTVNVKNSQTVNIGTTGTNTTTTNIRGFLNVTENVNLDAALTVFADTEFETGNVAITAGTFTSYGTTTLGNIVTNPTLTLLGTGTTTLGGALTVAAASTLNGNVAITGTKTLTVGTGATSLGGTLDVDGVSTFESASYFNEDVTIGSAIANKILTVYGTMIIDGGITSVAGSTGQGYELLSGINYDALNSNPTPTYDAYFQVDRYTSNPARLYWNESTDKWQADNGTTRSDIITAHNFTTTVNSASISAFKTHIKKQRYTATTNQTVFNLSSKCDQLDQCTEVFVNGILMEITDDYVITNANTITFTSGVPSGNKVMIKYNTWGITQ